MLNSKELLEQTGISRATLNNYIGWGIVPKPEILPPGPEHGDAPRIGYFPDDVLARIEDIQRLKKEGWSMARIAGHFGAPLPAPAAGSDTPLPGRTAGAAPAGQDEARTPQRDEDPLRSRLQDGDAADQRLPGLSDVAVLVAGLQHSTRIWSELPAQEYFELINHIWSTVDPIFRRHAGRHGRHPADGMVGCFLPFPGRSHLWNALIAAHEVRLAMRRVSKEWQLRKSWPCELYMNIGIDEGQEWLGNFRSSAALELTALATTLQQAVRISGFARFGAVWATKNLVGKLSPEERQLLRYGVRRRGGDGRHLFVPSLFTQLAPPAGHAAGVGHVPTIALLPITEIVEIPMDKSH